MKLKDLKPFEIPESILVSTYNRRGVAGYSNAYSSSKIRDVELPVISCKYSEVIIMGQSCLNARIGVIRGGKKICQTVRFYDDGKGGYEQNRNSIPLSFRWGQF